MTHLKGCLYFEEVTPSYVNESGTQMVPFPRNDESLGNYQLTSHQTSVCARASDFHTILQGC